MNPSAMHVAIGRALMRVGVMAPLALGLAACDLDRISDEEAMRLTEPSKRHPISAEIQIASLEVPTAPGASGIGSTGYFEVTRFARQYRADARGPLEIAVPRGHYAGPGLESVRHILKTNGVPSAKVRTVHRRDGMPGILLSYERIAAVAPVCGDWSENVGRRPEVGPYPNFGCATQRNIANMVADPTDIVVPRAEDARGSDRRNTVYKNMVGKPNAGGDATVNSKPNLATTTN